MRKLFLFVILGVIANFQTHSQEDQYSAGLGPSIGFPVSNKNFSYYYKNAIGASLYANFRITKLGSITAGLTYFHIGADKNTVDDLSLTLVKGGYRTNFSNSKVFVMADAGLALYGSKIFNGKSKLVTGGSVGYTFPVSKGSKLDVFPSCNIIISTSSNSVWLSVNLLYRFMLGR